mgnify:CR=1 FL=1
MPRSRGRLAAAGGRGMMRVGRTSITVDVEVYARRRALLEVVKVTEATLTYVAVDDERRPRPVNRDAG